jgi:hypothetical protein
VVVDPVEINLGVGDHSLTFYLREESTRLDKFELEPVSAPSTATSTPTGSPASPTPSPTPSRTPTPTPTGTSSPPVSSATPTPSPTATRPSGCGGLLQEAETGILAGSFTTGSDPAASGGQYVHAPPGSGFWDTVNGNGNRADYCFTVTTAGVYRIKGWVYGPSTSRNSFFVQVDGSPAAGYLWDVPVKSLYIADYVNDKRTVVVDPVEVNLGVGDHSLTFYLREDGTRLDKFELEPVSAASSAPSTPDGNSPFVTDTPTSTVVIAPTATLPATATLTATPVPTGTIIPTATLEATAASTVTPAGIFPTETATPIPSGTTTSTATGVAPTETATPTPAE